MRKTGLLSDATQQALEFGRWRKCSWNCLGSRYNAEFYLLTYLLQCTRARKCLIQCRVGSVKKDRKEKKKRRENADRRLSRTGNNLSLIPGSVGRR